MLLTKALDLYLLLCVALLVHYRSRYRDVSNKVASEFMYDFLIAKKTVRILFDHLYFHTKWTLRCRAVWCDDVKEWTNKTSPQSTFTVRSLISCYIARSFSCSSMGHTVHASIKPIIANSQWEDPMWVHQLQPEFTRPKHALCMTGQVSTGKR